MTPRRPDPGSSPRVTHGVLRHINDPNVRIGKRSIKKCKATAWEESARYAQPPVPEIGHSVQNHELKAVPDQNLHAYPHMGQQEQYWQQLSQSIPNVAGNSNSPLAPTSNVPNQPDFGNAMNFYQQPGSILEDGYYDRSIRCEYQQQDAMSENTHPDMNIGNAYQPPRSTSMHGRPNRNFGNGLQQQIAMWENENTTGGLVNGFRQPIGVQDNGRLNGNSRDGHQQPSVMSVNGCRNFHTGNRSQRQMATPRSQHSVQSMENQMLQPTSVPQHVHADQYAFTSVHQTSQVHTHSSHNVYDPALFLPDRNDQGSMMDPIGRTSLSPHTAQKPMADEVGNTVSGFSTTPPTQTAPLQRLTQYAAIESTTMTNFNSTTSPAIRPPNHQDVQSPDANDIDLLNTYGVLFDHLSDDLSNP